MRRSPTLAPFISRARMHRPPSPQGGLVRVAATVVPLSGAARVSAARSPADWLASDSAWAALAAAVRLSGSGHTGDEQRDRAAEEDLAGIMAAAATVNATAAAGRAVGVAGASRARLALPDARAIEAARASPFSVPCAAAAAAATIAGAAAAATSVAQSWSARVAPGARFQVPLSFAPTCPGAFEAVLVLHVHDRQHAVRLRARDATTQPGPLPRRPRHCARAVRAPRVAPDS